MNRALPPRDRGCGGGNTRGESGRRRLMPGASGLVRRTSHPPRETPPGRNPAARVVIERRVSGFDGVSALAILGLGGRHSQSHLLADRTGQKAAQGMRLPARKFHQSFEGCPARPFQQVQDLGRLAAVAGSARLSAACGRLFRRAGLTGRLTLLRRDVGAPWRNTGLLGWFRLRAVRALCRNGGGCVGFFGSHVGSNSLSARSRMTIHHSGWQELQVDSAAPIGEGEGLAMERERCDMTAGDSR